MLFFINVSGTYNLIWSMSKKILVSFSLLSGRPCSEEERRVYMYFSENKICMTVEKPLHGIISGLILFSVLYSAPRGFSPGTPVSPSPQKPTFPLSNSILEYMVFLNKFSWTPWCSMGKQPTYLHFFTGKTFKLSYE